MPASIDLTGLSSNDPRPGVYVEVNFAQGPASGSGGIRRMVVLANRTTAGTATVNTEIYGPDTPVRLQTEADMIALGGAGSEAHRMFRVIAKLNKTTPVYWVFVTESAGTAASTAITYVNAATGSGVVRVWIADEFVDVSVASGDSITTISTNVASAINAKTHWPVTASGGAGTVTITAKEKGPRGNGIRVQNLISSGITTVSAPTADTAFTSGATADSNTTALATILPKSFYYIVSAAGDATQLGALCTQVASQALPLTGIRQRVFAGSSDTVGNTNTIATGINNARAEIVHLYKSGMLPSELAAHAAAVYALSEANENNPRTNFNSYGNDSTTQASWIVPAPRDATAHPTQADFLSLLNNGVTPIGVNPNGSTFLVKRITTRSLSGSTADYRIRDAHKVTICDFFADALKTKTVLNYSGKRIANDPVQGQRPPGPSVVTPTAYKSGCVFRLIDDFDSNDLLQNVQDIKDGTIVQRETNPPTRMSGRVPLQPIDNLDQFALAVDQVA